MRRGRVAPNLLLGAAFHKEVGHGANLLLAKHLLEEGLYLPLQCCSTGDLFQLPLSAPYRLVLPSLLLPLETSGHNAPWHAMKAKLQAHNITIGEEENHH